MLSKNLEISLHRALNIAREFYHEYATIEHLLLALAEDPDAYSVLKTCGADIPTLCLKLRNFLNHELSALVMDHIGETRPTAGFQRVVHRAAITVNSNGMKEVTGANVLAEIFSEHESFAVYFLNEVNVFKQDVMRVIERGVMRFDQVSDSENDPTSFLPNDAEPMNETRPMKVPPSVAKEEKSATPALSKYCVNMNIRAEKGEIDILVGREEEVERTIEILCKRTKNNPLYIGEPGVGKTAIVEGLASRIVQKNVPPSIEKTVIYSLDMGSLLAGTRYRGDFEERIKTVISEIEKIPSAVLFIDEIHTIIGAGATSGGSLDASNLFKPALARGSFRCIGATTFKEYANYFEKDQALVRRFQKIVVEEPTVADTVKILTGLRTYYEKHHGVNYTDEAIESAASLSERYIHNQRLPDKAIDVMDEAGARAKLNKVDTNNVVVAVADIEQAIAKISQVPTQTISTGEMDKLLHLETNLKKIIYGQDDAIEELCAAVKMSRAGLRTSQRPIGCYLFAGPTGVGKTELAKQFSQSMNMELLRFDMSEYMEPHSASKLIGTPPGYVGFDQGGMLTDSVNNHPYSVVLLDEIEKANRDIYNLMLQVMDYGKLTDHNGKNISFTNCAIIMTTNVGASELQKTPIGFNSNLADNSANKDAINKFFTPEFINRLDAIIQFAPLSSETIFSVVDKFIKQLQEQLADRGVKIKVAADIKRYLAEHGYDEKYGARLLERIIQDKIKKPLADEILFGKLAKGGKASIMLKNNEIGFKVEAV